jgi:hypothetical protein
MSNSAAALLFWRNLGYYEFKYHDQKNGEITFGDVIFKQTQTIKHLNRFKKQYGTDPDITQLYILGAELVATVRANICFFYSFYYRQKTGNNKATSKDEMDHMCNFTTRILECFQDDDDGSFFTITCIQRHYTFLVELLYRIIWPLQCAFAFHAMDAMIGIEHIAFQLYWMFKDVDTDDDDIQYDILNMNSDRKCPLIIANNTEKHKYTYGRAMMFISQKTFWPPRIVVHNTESIYDSTMDVSMPTRVVQNAVRITLSKNHTQ